MPTQKPAGEATGGYQDSILEHARRPRFPGPMAGAERHGIGTNSLCGDGVTIYLRGLAVAEAGVEAAFVSEGCAICRASASILTEAVRGQSAAAAAALVARFRSTYPAPAGAAAAPADLPAAVQALYDLRRYPTRERCVLLPWDTCAELLAADEPPDPKTLSQ